MLKLWFHKGSKDAPLPAKLGEAAIKLFTGRYTHCEIEFSDGISFSSITDTGPRFARLAYQPRDEWDCLELPCTVFDERCMRATAETISRIPEKHYGWQDIGGGFLPVPLTWSDETAWICSSTITAVLQSASLLLGWIPQQTSPSEVADGVAAQLDTWLRNRFQILESI